MKYRMKIKVSAFLFLMVFVLSYCSQQKSKKENQRQESEYIKDEKKAIDSLKSRNLYNYLDSAYLYTYIYFGGDVIKRCGAVNIDSVLPTASNRKIVCQNLLLRKVRLLTDSSFVFLSLTPLVTDSILSCDMVEGAQLPHEIMFDYKAKRFIQFIYDENSFLRVNANPIADYENGLKKTIEREKLEPHKKFKELLSKLIAQ
jgi:hypothetical protein